MMISQLTIQKAVVKAAQATLALLLSLASMEASAQVAPTMNYVRTILAHGPNADSFVRSQSGRSELDLSYIRQLNQLARTELRMSPADFIPSRMKASESELKVAQQIVGHSLERWLSTSDILNGAVGDAIRSLEQPLNPSMKLQDAKGRSHKVDFNVKAARALASVTYTGFVSATLAYQATSRALALEVVHELNEEQKVVLNCTTAPSESRQMLAWQMSW